MMRCPKAEEWLFRFQDGFQGEEPKAGLEEHLRICPACARKEKEYEELRRLLRNEECGEPLPYFWERLQTRLSREKKPLGLLLWQRWCLRSVPVFLGAALVISAALFIFVNRAPDQMTQSELLLLKDQRAIAEIQAFMEEGKMEDKQMRLIFAGLDEIESIGRD